MNEYDSLVAQEQQFKVKLFQFPDWERPTAIFDYEDLENEEVLLVICARAKPDDENRLEDTVYIWHGSEHEVDPEEQKDFLQKCIQVYYNQVNTQGLKIQQEHSGDESPEFMQFFE